MDRNVFLNALKEHNNAVAERSNGNEKSGNNFIQIDYTALELDKPSIIRILGNPPNSRQNNPKAIKKITYAFISSP